MAVLTPITSKFGAKYRSLAPFRFLRGLACLLILVSSAFITLVFFGFISAVIVRLFSISYSRKTTSVFFAAWLTLWPFLFEKINKTKVVFSGDIVPSRERILLIANHRTEVDWMYLWDLALRKGCIGYIKYILKSSLMRLPIFGWAFHILEFIPVERKWEADESNMRRMLSTFKDPQDPLWLAIFPEGTDFT
jgi:lysocardiolipin and lysophospholipid acyltransferase